MSYVCLVALNTSWCKPVGEARPQSIHRILLFIRSFHMCQSSHILLVDILPSFPGSCGPCQGSHCNHISSNVRSLRVTWQLYFPERIKFLSLGKMTFGVFHCGYFCIFCVCTHARVCSSVCLPSSPYCVAWGLDRG